MPLGGSEDPDGGEAVQLVIMESSLLDFGQTEGRALRFGKKEIDSSRTDVGFY